MTDRAETIRASTANELEKSGTTVCCLDEPDQVAALNATVTKCIAIPVLTPQGRFHKVFYVILRSECHPLLQREYIPTREGHFIKEVQVWVGMDLDYHGPTADAAKFLQLLEVAAVAGKLHIQTGMDKPQWWRSPRRVFWMEMHMRFDDSPSAKTLQPAEEALIPAAARRHFRLLREIYARGHVVFTDESSFKPNQGESWRDITR